MSNDWTRRNFMKAASTTMGVAAAAGVTGKASAQDGDKIRVALIGTGSQNGVHVDDGIARNANIEVVALCDVLRPNLATGRGGLMANAGGDPDRLAFLKQHIYMDYRKMLDKEKDNIDAVIIATPFKTHAPIVLDCLDAGKYVFCEKTMAHTVEDCRAIVEKCHETGLWVQVGHQRRYNPEYIQAMNMLKNGDLGRVGYIEAQWHRNGDWRRPLPKDKNGNEYQLTDAEKKYIPDFNKHWNWRIYEEYSSGLLSELATHHLEVANFLLGTPPARVYGSGGIDFWRDDRTVEDNLTVTYEYEMSRSDHGFGMLTGGFGGNESLKPMNVNKPYTVRVNWSGTCQSAFKGASMMVVGNKGVLELRERIAAGMTDDERQKPEYQGTGCQFYKEPTVKWIDPDTGEDFTEDIDRIKEVVSRGESQKYKKIIKHEPSNFKDVLGEDVVFQSPDANQFAAFADHIKNGGVPRTNQMCGLMASISDIAGHKAVATGEVVEIDPAWYTFDFETPAPFEIGEIIA